MDIETLTSSLNTINKLLIDAKTDKRIDVKDLQEEKRNCLAAIKKLKKESK